ncbi:MAG: nucleotidyltransferase domain-containing protein [Betaproteobacteria bacterium]
MDASLPVADALFGKTRQAVLAMLFGNPGHAYYTREIVQGARSGGSQVQRELDQLTRSGLVTRERRANQVYYQANESASIYHELVVLVAKTFAIGDLLRVALVPFSTRIHVAFIYGSVARGEQHATSDVDVLVVGDVLLSDIEVALRDVERRITRTVSATIMDLKEFAKRRKEKEHFLRAVIAGPKIFLIGGPAQVQVNDASGAR